MAGLDWTCGNQNMPSPSSCGTRSPKMQRPRPLLRPLAHPPRPRSDRVDLSSRQRGGRSRTAGRVSLAPQKRLVLAPCAQVLP